MRQRRRKANEFCISIRLFGIIAKEVDVYAEENNCSREIAFEELFVCPPVVEPENDGDFCLAGGLEEEIAEAAEREFHSMVRSARDETEMELFRDVWNADCRAAEEPENDADFDDL